MADRQLRGIIAKHEARAGSAVDAIEFSLTIDDHSDMRAFLDAWMHGDLSEWPEYRPDAPRVGRPEALDARR